MEQYPLVDRPGSDAAGAAVQKSAAGITWDLSIFYSGPDDPRITSALQDAAAQADEFERRYRGTLNGDGGPSADDLLAALQTYERLQESLVKTSAYSSLLYAAD